MTDDNIIKGKFSVIENVKKLLGFKAKSEIYFDEVTIKRLLEASSLYQQWKALHDDVPRFTTEYHIVNNELKGVTFKLGDREELDD